MRILRLAIEGFGPFKDEQVVDFRHFDGEGLFLITGRTGAGKSSILDAICFALYGQVPRYDGTEQRLRSDHCDPDDRTRVTLDFSVDGTAYRLVRAPTYDRPKRSGNGTTPEKATAELFVGTAEGWEGIAARPVDVAPEIARIVGLTKEQFLQVMLLAQNRFQQFLLAKNDERQRVLQSLFGTKRFEKLEVAIVDRRRELDVRMEQVRSAIETDAARAATLLGLEETPEHPDAAWFEFGLESLTAEAASATVAAEVADAARTGAAAAKRAVDDTLKLQSRRVDAAAQLADLETEETRVAADREAIEAGRRSSIVWPLELQHRAAQTAVDDARRAEIQRRADYGPDGDHADSAALARDIDDLTRQLGTVEQALGDEVELATLDSNVTALQEQADASARAERGADELIEHLPARLDELGAQHSAARVASAGRTDLERRRAEVATRREAAASAVRLETRRSAAVKKETEAARASAVAAAEVHALLERRLAGFAGELADALVEGQPCGVCGSTSHPDPADSDAAPVTTFDIEYARTEAQRAASLADERHRLASELESQLAAARATAEEHPTEHWDAEAGILDEGLGAISVAEQRLAALGHEIAAATAELATAAARRDAARADRAAATESLAAARAQQTALRKRVERARGDFASVAARARELSSHRDIAAALDAAIAESGVRETTAAAASAAVEAQLVELGFSDAAAMEASRLTDRESAELERRIRRHDDARAAASATLADPEVAGAPMDAVDPVPVAAALESAALIRDAAMSASTSARTRVDQLRRVVESVRARAAASAGLIDEHRQLRELANVVEGKDPNLKRMRLETYVLAARLEEIVDAANVRLTAMTGGRYSLEHDDDLAFRRAQSGLGLAIRDEHSGRARATHSLSGGETFLASLALALGLAEVVTNQSGGIRLDTLFIDEGFGSLDGDTLEIAMSTLDGLRAGGRTIGVISHVEAMKEQIPAKLHITVGAQGHSRVEESVEVAG